VNDGSDGLSVHSSVILHMIFHLISDLPDR
jgi:hypothetical protein